jgi:hypothetical protein
MLLGFEIEQRWPEAVMHSCGSYFVIPGYNELRERAVSLSAGLLYSLM